MFLEQKLRRSYYKIFKSKQFVKMMKLRQSTISPDKYSLKCFDESKSLFVHIPKSAGISVAASLYGCRAGGHMKMSDYTVIYSKAELNKLFKFGFVRNPWDRVYSAFNFLRSGGINESDREFSKNLIAYNTFEDFITNGLLRKEIFNHVHFLPQSQFLFYRNKLAVDFVGRYETITTDFSYVCDKLGRDVVLESKNESKKDENDFRQVYTREMVSIVASLYKDDIVNFNYNFDT